MKYQMPKEMKLTKKEFCVDLFRLLYGDGFSSKEYTMKHYARYRELGFDFFAPPENGDIVKRAFYSDLIGFFAGAKKALTDKEIYGFGETIEGYTDNASVYAFLGIFPDKECEGFTAEMARNDRTVIDWLAGTTNSFREVDKNANRFAYLLLRNSELDMEDFKVCYRNWLSHLGITDIGEELFEAMTTFDWTKAQEVSMECAKGKDPLRVSVVKDKAILFFFLVMFSIFSLIGKNVETNKKYLERLYGAFEVLFKDEIKHQESVEKHIVRIDESIRFSQKALFECIKTFEPRSISSDDVLLPEDYYIPAEFTCAGTGSSSPIASFSTSQTSCRRLIYAKTGSGKSMYMQMVALCMLNSSLGKEEGALPLDENRKKNIDRLAGDLGTPEDCLVISIPAKMYSFLYNSGNAAIMNQDFVELFFYAMWRSSSKYNFYSLQNFESEVPRAAGDSSWVYDEMMKSRIDSYARQGKLILLLDSFDEVGQGDMRDKYLASIGKFCDRYCKYSDDNCIGAHILMTTRQMSDETMDRVKSHLGIYGKPQSLYTISPLSDNAKRRMIADWYNGEDRSPEEVFDYFRKNHFYSAYSVNPYMLSVACNSYDKGENLGDITKKFIDTLIERMRANHAGEDYTVEGVFSEVKDILKEVAAYDVIKHRKVIDKDVIRGQIRGKMSVEIDADEVEGILDRLLEIFITEAGIIVPADGDDSAYQFINE